MIAGFMLLLVFCPRWSRNTSVSHRNLLTHVCWIQGRVSVPVQQPWVEHHVETFCVYPAAQQCLRLCLNLFANVCKGRLSSSSTHFPTTALTWVRISPTYWSICAWKQETVWSLTLGFLLADIPWCSHTNLMLLIDHRHGEHGDHSCRETGNV